MCGRYVIKTLWQTIIDAFDAVAPPLPDLFARYNVAPTQPVPVVRLADDGRRHIAMLRWGLIPFWARERKSLPQMINARSETAAARPAFREAMRKRRCLIPADGFYEWKHEGKEKLPFCFTLADDAVFAFAGLWERWRSPLGEMVESCTILTTAPNELVQDIHDRMPVILARDSYDLWLDPGFTRVPELQPLLKPYPAGAMRRYRVSQRLDQGKNDDLGAC